MLPRFNWREFSQTPNILSVLAKLAILLFFTFVIFFQDLGQVINLALSNSEVQYILIVPLVAAFFAYKQRKAFHFPSQKNHLQDISAIATCLVALTVYIYGSYSLFPIELHLLTLPIFMGGLTLLLFGKDTLRSMIFPIALLIFVSPLPIFFSDRYSGFLIDSTSSVSVSILKLFLPITFTLRPAAVINTITSSGQPLNFEIAPACSGIYSLITMIFLSAVFLYVISCSWLKKTLFATLAIAIAFLFNVLRIVLTISLGYAFGYGTAVEFFHNFGGTALMFLGTLFLIVAADKVLKFSFTKKRVPNCTHNSTNSGICYSCGKIFNFNKTPLNWKRLGTILLLTLIVAALFMQASAATFNKASSDQNNSIRLNLSNGGTTTFSGLTGWSTQFLGRETESENRLGIFYVGDYVLSNSNFSYINAIVEVSDAQSKFHTWEGCLNYQDTPMNIIKTNVLTLYDQQNTIVTAETMIADIPKYNQKLLLIYWFDSANLKINGTSSPWALKITLYQTVNNSTDTTNAINYLTQLGTQIENSWSQFKNPSNGFSVDIYRNITPIFAIVAALLIGSLILLQVQSQLTKRQLTINAKDLDPEILKQLNTLTKKTGQIEEPEISNSDSINQLRQDGFIKEKYSLINGEPYLNWKSQMQK